MPVESNANVDLIDGIPIGLEKARAAVKGPD
jgi:hypothetical protein